MEAADSTFSFVEYLSILTAIVYGYVATRFFSGWSAMINFRRQILVSWDYLLWTLLTFGLLIDVWWGSWLKGSYISKHVGLYYLSLLSPLIFYFISVIFFPPLVGAEFFDLKSYLIRSRKRIYFAFIALFLSFLLGSRFFKDSVPEDIYFNMMAIVILLTGIFLNKIAVHRLILILGWILLIVHIGLLAPMEMTDVDNFSFTEYLTIFIAFIYGFIASRFFSGCGVMIAGLDRIIPSMDHLGWTLLSFVLLLDLWIGSWIREPFVSRSIQYFILSLTTPLAFYFLSAVIFPIIRNGERTDMKLFFSTHRRVIIFMLGMVLLVNLVVANLLEEPIWSSRENFFRVISIAMMIVAITSAGVFWERSMLLAGWVLLICHILLESNMLPPGVFAIF